LAASVHGSFVGHLGDEGDDSVNLGIDAVDLLEVLGERFAGGELLRTNKLGHLDCAGETKRGGCGFGCNRGDGEERSCGNPCQDFAAGWLVGDHVGDFIIWGLSGKNRPRKSHFSTSESPGGGKVMVNRRGVKRGMLWWKRGLACRQPRLMPRQIGEHWPTLG
jgi:hypothetical protein